MGDIAQRGNKLTKGVKDLATAPYKAAKKVAHGAKDLITSPSKRIKKFGGGRTNLLEELGRVEAEPSNRNRRAEISRVHSELNRGYKTGGRVGLKKFGKPWGTGPKPGTHDYLMQQLHKPKKGKAAGGRATLKKGGKSDKNWIQKAVNPKHKGYCTPMTKKTCTPRRKALAKTFKKKAKTGW